MKILFKKNYVFVAGMCIAFAAVAATMFMSQQQRYINRDPAANATDVISTLSCILHHSGAHLEATAANPNPAPYEVLIDVDSCRPNAAVTENTTPIFSRYWIEPRYDNGSLVVKAWQFGSLRPAYILAKIQAGRDVNPPFGQWTVDWCTERLATESPSLLTTDPCARKGHITITADQNYELFYREEISGSQTELEKSTKGFIASNSTFGGGKYFEKFNNNNSTVREGAFSFVSGALLDELNGTQSCKDPRSAGNLKRTVWEAWLYDPTSQERVSYNGGFPVKSVDGRQLGWAGFEGVRLNGSSDPTTTGEFIRVDGVGGNYQAFGSYGKLIKNTNTVTPNGLRDLDKVILRTRLRKDAFSDLSDFVVQGATTNLEQFVLFYWDHSISKFTFIARDKYLGGPNVGKEFVRVQSTVSLSPEEYLEYAQIPSRSFERRIWAFQMGSNNNFVIQLADNDVGEVREGRFYPTPKAPNDIQVFRQIQTNVVPGSADAPTENLVCIGKCPRPNGSSTLPRLTLEADYEFPRNDPRVQQEFVYNNTTGNLTINGHEVRFEPSHINRNGIDATRDDLWLGTFITRNQLSGLECRDGFCVWDNVGYARRANDGLNTFGDMGLTSYYNWNTGPNRWHKFSGVKDSSGRVVPINEPLMLTYNAPDENEFGHYRGKKVSIRYPGNGALWLPGRCENTANPTLAVSSGCNQTNEAFIHDFVIPTDLGPRGQVSDATGRTYLVKWARQGVFYPQHSDSRACDTPAISSGFVAAKALVLPTSSRWTNPRTGLGAAPVGASAASTPRYINGVLQ